MSAGDTLRRSKLGLALLLSLEYPVGRSEWDKTCLEVCRATQGLDLLYTGQGERVDLEGSSG